jgi:hypothetical protein
METYALYKRRWDEVLNSETIPSYLRSVVRTSFPQFRNDVYSGSRSFCERFVDSIFGGDLWIIDGALSAEKVAESKRLVLSFREGQPETDPKIVEGVRNYHQIFDGSAAPKGGYVAADHSHYFYRWNGDDHGLFALVDDIWKLTKIVSGKAPNEYESNTPKDFLIDKIHVIQYPSGAGKITEHVDPYITMKVNVGIFLTTRGVDYDSGGFFISRGPKQPVMLDSNIRAGDMVLWFPHLVHGVETVDTTRVVDWKSTGGRWYLHLNTVESGLVKERHVARPAE